MDGWMGWIEVVLKADQEFAYVLRYPKARAGLLGAEGCLVRTGNETLDMRMIGISCTCSCP